MFSSWICVDASLVVRLVVDAGDDRLLRQWEEWDGAGRQLVAPTLLYYEVTNAIYQYHKHQFLTAKTSQQALEAALALPIQLHGERGLHRQALRFAQRYSLPATYDAHYLALADQLGAEFWTADQRLAATLESNLSWIRLYR